MSHLYYCRDCRLFRCPECIQEEGLFAYCPNCLTEEVSAGVKKSRGRCARGCYECPVCARPARVVGDKGKGGYLKCYACRWTSTSLGQEINAMLGTAIGSEAILIH